MERKSIERLVSIQSRKPLDFSALTAVDSIEEAGKPDGGGCWRPDSVCARAIVPSPAQTRATIVAICATFSFIARRYKTRIWSLVYCTLVVRSRGWNPVQGHCSLIEKQVGSGETQTTFPLAPQPICLGRSGQLQRRSRHRQ